LNDAEWTILAPLLPKAKTGRPRVHAPRELLDAIWYIVRSGEAWRMLPHDFPAWHTVYAYFRLLKQKAVWPRLNEGLRTQIRAREGREAEPSTSVIDSQSVRTAEKGGFAAWMGARR